MVQYKETGWECTGACGFLCTEPGDTTQAMPTLEELLDKAGSSRVLTTLTPLTSIKAPDKVVWTLDSDKAFVALKVSVCNSVCMGVPTADDTYVLYTDASARVVGACLYVRRDSKELPVGLFSRILRDAEVRYTTGEREALAIVAALCHFETYLCCQEVTVCTDYQPNLALIDGALRSNLNSRLCRFALKLQEQVCRIIYVTGASLSNANGLSRISLEDEENVKGASPGF